MKCFYHPDNFAIGICKACSKGLCRECTSDIGNGLACKNKCEEEVKAINMAVVKAQKDKVQEAKLVLRTSFFLGMAGIAFLIFASLRNFDLFLIVMGIILMITAFWSYFISKALQKQ